MKKKGFIFDLDGVIVDTAKYHYLAWKKLANQLGFEFTEEQNEMFKGVSRKRCLEILLKIGGVSATREQFDTWMVEKNVDYLQYIDKMDASEILPEVNPRFSSTWMTLSDNSRIYLCISVKKFSKSKMG